MRKKLCSLCCTLVLVLIISGCGGSSSPTHTVGFDGFMMDIDKTYESTKAKDHYNTKLGSRPVIVYSKIDSSNKDFVENIAITKIPFQGHNVTASKAINVMLDSIQNTFGSYEKVSLQNRSFSCENSGEETTSIDAVLHRYTIQQGDFTQTTTHHLTQYYFVHTNRMYIISGVSNTEEQSANYASYFKTLKCKPQDT